MLEKMVEKLVAQGYEACLVFVPFDMDYAATGGGTTELSVTVKGEYMTGWRAVEFAKGVK